MLSLCPRNQGKCIFATVASIYVSIVYSNDIRENASGSSKNSTCLGSLGTSASGKINLLCCPSAQGVKASTVVATVIGIYVSIVYRIAIRENSSSSSLSSACLGSLGSSASRKINLLYCHSAQGPKASAFLQLSLAFMWALFTTLTSEEMPVEEAKTLLALAPWAAQLLERSIFCVVTLPKEPRQVELSPLSLVFVWGLFTALPSEKMPMV